MCYKIYKTYSPKPPLHGESVRATLTSFSSSWGGDVPKTKPRSPTPSAYLRIRIGRGMGVAFPYIFKKGINKANPQTKGKKSKDQRKSCMFMYQQTFFKFLVHLSHSGDLLLWFAVLRRPSSVVRRALTSSSQELQS